MDRFPGTRSIFVARGALLAWLLVVPGAAAVAAPALPLVPAPRELRYRPGEARLSPSWIIRPATGDDEQRQTAELVADEARAVFHWEWRVDPAADHAAIRFVVEPPEPRRTALEVAQGYRLAIGRDGIEIRATTATGLFYGAQ